MKILVRNLPRELTETELTTLFSEYGRLQSCNLVIDKATGESKGFGFVEMPLVNEAKAAIAGLNGKEISGLKIRVKKADTVNK
jgi:RNA recognition motif-containing protein